MRISAEVLSVSSTGDQLEVKAQGWERGASINSPFPCDAFTFRIRDTIPSRRAFYVGRLIDVEIKPRGPR